VAGRDEDGFRRAVRLQIQGCTFKNLTFAPRTNGGSPGPSRPSKPNGFPQRCGGFAKLLRPRDADCEEQTYV
jgi:hypothetical protein